MNIGDHVRAKHPFAGVPIGEGIILKALTHPSHPTQFLVRFVTKTQRVKEFYLSERELTLVTPQPPVLPDTA